MKERRNVQGLLGPWLVTGTLPSLLNFLGQSPYQRVGKETLLLGGKISKDTLQMEGWKIEAVFTINLLQLL